MHETLVGQQGIGVTVTAENLDLNSRHVTEEKCCSGPAGVVQESTPGAGVDSWCHEPDKHISQEVQILSWNDRILVFLGGSPRDCGPLPDSPAQNSTFTI